MNHIKKYEVLKQDVIRHFKEYSHELIERALSSTELADKQPSQLINEVKRRFSEIDLKADEKIITNHLPNLFGNTCIKVQTFNFKAKKHVTTFFK